MLSGGPGLLPRPGRPEVSTGRDLVIRSWVQAKAGLARAANTSMD